MTEEQDELIAVENRKKENCIHHLLQMCYTSGVKVFDILPAYGADKAIGAAIICYVGHGNGSGHYYQRTPGEREVKWMKKS